MIKMVLGALAALTALVAAPAMAQVTPPAHVKMITVTLGHLGEDHTVPVTVGGKTLKVKISNCEAAWADGDAFYAIATADSNPYVMHKKLMDYAYSETKGDWDTALSAMAAAKQICRLDPVE